jgi:hypothetical protein
MHGRWLASAAPQLVCVPDSGEPSDWCARRAVALSSADRPSPGQGTRGLTSPAVSVDTGYPVPSLLPVTVLLMRSRASVWVASAAVSRACSVMRSAPMPSAGRRDGDGHGHLLALREYPWVHTRRGVVSE